MATSAKADERASANQARGAHRLTAMAVRGLRQPGKYGDGDGLWLVVATPERRAWVLRYMRQGKSHEMTLGNVDIVGLAEARERASDARRLLAQGIDPLDQRHAAREVRPTAPAHLTTFAEAAERYLGQHEAGWRNPKHRQQWRNTLATYAHPSLGALPVTDVGTPEVLRVLSPLWSTKPETASRVRGRIEAILDYARVQGWRDGPNPALWRGHLQLALPARAKVRAVQHHAALDWRETPAFMAKLRARDSFGARALEFAILTAARSGEVRGATWAEVDIERATWIIPAPRMKAKRQHRVPLSAPAVAIIKAMAALRQDDAPSGFVFPGMRQSRPLSDMSLTAVLRRMGRGELTAHGFRSTFRDWVSEGTTYAGEMAESALAHAVGSKVEAAYRRGDLLAKRAEMMADWAAFCHGPALPV
ncbi:tyrosine-type recombinase/integrase [Rhodopila sp.]|uniref:tyrosine-type recombinase/integrase n=1 Tax=Rhodopila sp. TaxID=2480087 RepID=UPI003D106ECC